MKNVHGFAQAGLDRRKFLIGATTVAGAAIGAPSIVRADIPKLRYSTGGGLGPNEIVTILLTDWAKQNILKRHGKDYVLETTYARGTPEAASLLAAGQVDLSSMSLPAFGTMIAKGAVPNGVKIVAEMFQDGRDGFASQGFYVLEDSPIRSVADLKGKTIAVNAFGTAVDLVLRVVLKKNNLDPRRDVKIVEVSFPSIGAAIREKRVDCGSLPLPFSATENAKGGIRPVFHGRDAFPPYAVLFQIASNDYLKSNGPAVKAWLADYVDGLRWLYDPANRKRVIELTSDLTKSPPEVLETYFLTKNDYFRDPASCITTDLLQPPLDAMVREGLLPSAVDAAKYLDTSYLPASCKA
ncbi:MAG: transporter substrate binding protein [Enterovirga sp.]|nr:transporter substrate binding protein [Enterovirga sp.]